MGGCGIYTQCGKRKVSDFAALALEQRRRPLNNVRQPVLILLPPRSDLPRTCVANAAYYITLDHH